MNLGQTMKDEIFLAQIHFVLGRLYCLKQDYEPSIYFHEKHLQYAEEIHDKKGQHEAYTVLSELCEKTNQLDKAEKYRQHSEQPVSTLETKKQLLKVNRRQVASPYRFHSIV